MVFGIKIGEDFSKIDPENSFVIIDFFKNFIEEWKSYENEDSSLLCHDHSGAVWASFCGRERHHVWSSQCGGFTQRQDGQILR